MPSVSRADLIEAAKHADVALEFEALANEDGHDIGSVSRRGAVDWTLRTSAESGHSSEDSGRLLALAPVTS